MSGERAGVGFQGGRQSGVNSAELDGILGTPNKGQDVIGQYEEVREISWGPGGEKLGTNISRIVKQILMFTNRRDMPCLPVNQKEHVNASTFGR